MADHLALLRMMLRVRRFDERVIALFRDGIVKGTAHSCVGQEAIAAASCAHLTDEDWILTHHRGHGHTIAKGASMERMMAELMGRATGYCGGLGGSMHIADLSLGILGANGVVGAGPGLACGAALASLLAGGSIGIVFFGDGAANEGVVHEAMNVAALWRLPLIFLCENNLYGLSTSQAESTAGPGLAARAGVYGMHGVTVDGNDAVALHATVGKAAARARGGDGPSFIEARTWRWGDHSMRANLPAYRAEEEEREGRARDPIARLEATILAAGLADAASLATLRAAVDAEIEQAVTAARAAPEPEWETMAPAVAPPLPASPNPPPPGEREISYVEAINEALHEAMTENERVLLIGEDVGRIGGIFGCSRGLRDRFGPARVRDTPISEQAIGGLAVGAALRGYRPVAEVQIFDFVTLMMDMIVNQAAKARFMLGGAPTVPIVIRGPQGGGIRLAAQHSQCLEAWFAHVPGLVVVAPATPYDAKGLLMSAIRHDGPVVFCEHKLLYVEGRGPVPEGAYALPLGRADIKRPGRDITIVAIQAMVPRALAAARTLAREGIEAEVIDPRTIRPLDIETIAASVRRTSRCLIVHEACITGGIGAEISARVQEECFDWLDAPVTRLGNPDLPIPYNDTLERAVIPDAARIVAAVRTLAGRHAPA
ncbi:dehydrogenase E1 component subunit alpha/beta [Elioraea sp.]|uniref:alpha-ketoacid dehydrogenase subunit alpha/beta n=1 Tax=Elioraea sp. TaxID=2185103 RepID=UPI0025BB702C|nr:dehydrogenase E1 component subunit alpha/beta [Elioraea sp.]